MKFENTKVFGLENAIIGMRLPMCKDFTEAQEKCDSSVEHNGEYAFGNNIKIGEKDLNLMKNLISADKSGGGQPNSKFLRMIHVQAAITGPLYWWKEMSTYKVGTTANSSSTMHRITNYPITQECFELPIFDETLEKLENLRVQYNETKDKDVWKQLIVNLPESWLQTRMWDADYATLRNIYKWRKNHKLTEWHDFCKWVETLLYAEELICS